MIRVAHPAENVVNLKSVKMESNSNKEHWENIYSTKEPTDVSWFQVYPKTSMEFVELFNLKKSHSIIDIGGGDSVFVDALIEAGFTDITVLDISAAAIEKAKKRLGKKSDDVTWIVSDVIDFSPEKKYRFWHDRAAFHFLTNEMQADKYVQIAKEGVAQNGHLILGTFSETGPTKCSGLTIKQYSEESMSNKFEDGFERVKCKEEIHHTPFNTTQNFLFCSYKKI